MQNQYNKMEKDYTEKVEMEKEQINSIKKHLAKLEPDQERLEIAIEKFNIEIGQMDHTIKELNEEKIFREEEIEKFKVES